MAEPTAWPPGLIEYGVYWLVLLIGIVLGWGLKWASDAVLAAREPPDETARELVECRQRLDAKTNELLRLKMANQAATGEGPPDEVGDA